MGNHRHVVLQTSVENIDWKELSELFQQVNWEGYNMENVEKAFRNSYIVCFAFIDNKLVGCGRSISDGVRYAAIYDVVVAPHMQGKGIGHKLVDSLLNHLKDIPFVHLTTTIGKETFYEQFGLRKHKTAMARYLDEQKANIYLEPRTM
ncbi:GNAT family N-acetyltransferase [Salirhabdus salicampi]|uniref:GNAT family N-acetyltransferase n=1 Tax=Salirhabdus salicampi TaxID=476102 RepID=UPI0020C39180|nr:GNAT family N-acetyltransferase [Salirhabdus salicampi]